jgi:hypothetical protein
MSLFIRLLGEEDKGAALGEAVRSVAEGAQDPRVFEVAPESFEQVPGAPFAYWVSEGVRHLFLALSSFQSEGRAAKLGGSTKNDFRFLRLWWGVPITGKAGTWRAFAKGGAYSAFYADIYIDVNWCNDAREIEAELLAKFP